MAESDRAAVGVDRPVEVERPDGRPAATPAKASLISHRSTSAAGEAVAGEQALRGLGRPQVEGGVRARDDGAADDLGERLEARRAGAASRS